MAAVARVGARVARVTGSDRSLAKRLDAIERDVDIVTGIFRLQGTSDHWLEVWENQKVSARGPGAGSPAGTPGARSN